MPFTQEQFLDVFRAYNAGVFPWQIVLHVVAFLMALLTVFFARLKHRQLAGRFTGGVLAVLWMWMGLVYHFGYFLSINPAAQLFGILFVLQAIAFLVVFVVLRPADFPHPSISRRWLGGLLVLLGLVIYPLLNVALGHGFVASPTFGAPCPTTIFTLGILLLTKNAHWTLWFVPVGWTAIGGSGAFLLDIPQDYTLIFAGVVSLGVLLASSIAKSANPR